MTCHGADAVGRMFASVASESHRAVRGVFVSSGSGNLIWGGSSAVAKAIGLCAREGTRVAPGVSKPYKVGTAVLYKETGQTCIPAATNVGVFWPRTGIYRKPGVAVVEFLPPIEQGLSQQDFMTQLEDVVETASDRLLEEAGFHAVN